MSVTWRRSERSRPTSPLTEFTSVHMTGDSHPGLAWLDSRKVWKCLVDRDERERERASDVMGQLFRSSVQSTPTTFGTADLGIWTIFSYRCGLSVSQQARPSAPAPWEVQRTGTSSHGQSCMGRKTQAHHIPCRLQCSSFSRRGRSLPSKLMHGWRAYRHLGDSAQRNKRTTDETPSGLVCPFRLGFSLGFFL